LNHRPAIQGITSVNAVALAGRSKSASRAMTDSGGGRGRALPSTPVATIEAQTPTQNRCAVLTSPQGGGSDSESAESLANTSDSRICEMPGGAAYRSLNLPLEGRSKSAKTISGGGLELARVSLCREVISSQPPSQNSLSRILTSPRGGGSASECAESAARIARAA
jgi:hypothetical protein